MMAAASGATARCDTLVLAAAAVLAALSVNGTNWRCGMALEGAAAATSRARCGTHVLAAATELAASSVADASCCGLALLVAWSGHAATACAS